MICREKPRRIDFSTQIVSLKSALRTFRCCHLDRETSEMRMIRFCASLCFQIRFLYCDDTARALQACKDDIRALLLAPVAVRHLGLAAFLLTQLTMCRQFRSLKIVDSHICSGTCRPLGNKVDSIGTKTAAINTKCLHEGASARRKNSVLRKVGRCDAQDTNLKEQR